MADRRGRYAAFTDALTESVLATPGHTPVELRQTVLARAARQSGRTAHGGRDGGESIPAPIAAYVDKVARHAYKVTDADFAALQRTGNSDDALFEVTVAAALGAALGRLERGLAALRGEEPD